VLQASADALLFDGAKGVVSSPPVVDPPELRRLRRLMRRASPRALRFVERILDAIDERTQGRSRAPDDHAQGESRAPDEHAQGESRAPVKLRPN
jgi:hypothetical protein